MCLLIQVPLKQCFKAGANTTMHPLEIMFLNHHHKEPK